MTTPAPRGPDRLLQLGLAYQRAKTLLTAVELGVFTVLADRPLDLETLRQTLGIDRRGARDFMDALVALGLLVRDADARYANTAETDRYLDRNKSTYIGGVLEHNNARHFAIWNSLTEALRTGRPQAGLDDPSHFQELFTDERALGHFVNAMTVRSRPVAEALAAAFPWTRYRSMVDIGCSQGAALVQIACSHPHISGVGFDLPHLQPHFGAYVASHALADRLRFQAGDFFRDPLPGAEVLMFGRVLHNWDLAAKTMLLKKAYDALPPGGTLIVYERLIDDERRTNAAALLSSLNMLLMSAGGFDFTAADGVGWMREAGYRDIRVEPLTADQSMIVGVK